MKTYFQKNKTTILNLITLMIVILLSYVFFQYAFPFISPFILGFILSLVFNPFVSMLEKRFSCHRSIGSIISILLLISFFFIVVMGIWNKLYSETILLFKNLPTYLETLESSMDTFSLKWQGLKEIIPTSLQVYFSQLQTGLASAITSLLQRSGSESMKVLGAIPNIFMIIIVSFISSYFFTKDKESIAIFTKKNLPSFGENLDIAKKNLKYSLVAYFKTQLILMGYTFTICIIGLLILKSPYALLLSVVISIIDAIPFFGSGFILWPGAIIYFITGNNFLGVGYLIIYLCVNLVRQILQPKILGTQIGLHPLLTLISMYVGLKTLGILGMIIGPIIAVLLKAILEVRKSVGK